MKHATPEQVQRGLFWYSNAHAIAERIAKENSLTLNCVAGMIAALSPGTRWEQNIDDTIAVIRNGAWATVTTYTANKKKALKILAGEYPEAVLGGNKVVSFYHNIINPSSHDWITLDRHMLRALLELQSDKEMKRFFDSKKHYEALAESIRIAALRFKLVPSQLQAIIWEVQREV